MSNKRHLRVTLEYNYEKTINASLLVCTMSFCSSYVLGGSDQLTLKIANDSSCELTKIKDHAQNITLSAPGNMASRSKHVLSADLSAETWFSVKEAFSLYELNCGDESAEDLYEPGLLLFYSNPAEYGNALLACMSGDLMSSVDLIFSPYDYASFDGFRCAVFQEKNASMAIMNYAADDDLLIES